MIPINPSYHVPVTRRIAPAEDVKFYIDLIAKEVHNVAMRTFKTMNKDEKRA